MHLVGRRIGNKHRQRHPLYQGHPTGLCEPKHPQTPDMRIFPVQVILHNVDAQVECRNGRTGDLDFSGHWVLGGTDRCGKRGVVDRDGTKGYGDPAVGFIEVVLTDLKDDQTDIHIVGGRGGKLTSTSSCVLVPAEMAILDGV